VIENLSTDGVFKSIHQQMHVGEIFSDFEKAFDCMDHRILLAKLHLYGIWGVSEDWFSSYLTNRRYKVEVKSPNSTQNFFSDWVTLTYKVCQGSITGPVFIIYINDLSLRNSVSEPILFIDDTSVIISSRNFGDFCSVSNIVLSCMSKWFAAK